MQHKFFRYYNAGSFWYKVEIPRIKHFRYHCQCNEPGFFKFGNAIASSIEFEYDIGNQSDLAVGDPIAYSQVYDVSLKDFKTEIPNGYEMFINLFFVEKYSKKGNTATVIAYDALNKLDVDYSKRMIELESSFPLTTQELVSDISNYIGIPINGFGSTEKVNYFYSPGITARTILSCIAELRGTNAVASTSSYDYPNHVIRIVENHTYGDWKTPIDGAYSFETGRYVIAPTDQQTYVKNSITLTPVVYKQCGLVIDNEQNDPIDAVRFVKLNGTVGDGYNAVPHPTNIYEIRNNIIFEHLATYLGGYSYGIYNRIQAINNSQKAKAKIFPFMNPMVIQSETNVVDKNGSILPFIVMNIDWTDSEVLVENYGIGKEQFDTSDMQNVGSQNQVSTSVLNNLSSTVSEISSIVGDGVLDPLFSATSLTEAANELVGDVKTNRASIGASEYDDTSTYSVGDYVIYNYTLYRCNTDIENPEAWDSTHWDYVTVLDIKVDRTGDTMTGDLYIKNDDFALEDAPNPNSYRYLMFSDKNDINYAYVRGTITETESGIYMMGRRVVNGTGVNHAFGMYVDDDGVKRTSFTDVASREAWQRALMIAPYEISDGANLNNVYRDGFYKCTSGTKASALSNCPYTSTGFVLMVMSLSSGDTPTTSSAKVQVLFAGSTVYVRRRTTSSWGSWYRYSGTAV